jgi:acetyl esterase/lipase
VKFSVRAAASNTRTAERGGKRRIAGNDSRRRRAAATRLLDAHPGGASNPRSRREENVLHSIAAMLAWTAVAIAPPTGAAKPAQLKWADLTERPRPVPDTTVRYGTDALQVVDVWLPRGRGPFPTVLMVHGGCWMTDIADRRLMDWAADDLRRRGIAVWNIDYRGVDRPGGGYPGTFQDVAAAADALRANAARLHLDRRRLVAVGHSAGGHLALWLAARRRLPAASLLHDRRPLRLRTVISLGGLPDLEQAAVEANGCPAGVSAKLAAGHYAETSLPRLAPLKITQILVNGTQDRIIPNRFATDYWTRMRAAGDRLELHWVAGGGHVDLIAPGTTAWDIVVRDISAALRD